MLSQYELAISKVLSQKNISQLSMSVFLPMPRHSKSENPNFNIIQWHLEPYPIVEKFKNSSRFVQNECISLCEKYHMNVRTTL